MRMRSTRCTGAASKARGQRVKRWRMGGRGEFADAASNWWWKNTLVRHPLS